MKRIFLFVLVLFTLCLPVLADEDIDMGYSGALDTYTGEPVSGGGTKEDQQYVQESVRYDKKTKRYLYQVAGISQEIASTVVDGMITTGTVSIKVPTGISADLYRDGEKDSQDIGVIRKAGSYSLNVTSPGYGSVTVLSFTIIPECTGKLDMYRMPEDFLVTKLRLNDEDIEFNPMLVNFTEEGDYEVEYLCYTTKVVYTLQLTVDRTPPQLTIIGTDEKGIARGPVSIKLSEDVVAAGIVFEGVSQSFDERVTKTGHYEVLAEDEAGNRVTASFTIMMYLNAASVMFIFVLVLLLVILIIYLIRYRGRMKVR